MEVDLTAVAIIIIVDICITLGLLMVVYYWSKNKKAKAKPVTRGTGAGGRPRGKTIELGQETSSLGQDGHQVYTADSKELHWHILGDTRITYQGSLFKTVPLLPP